MKFKGSFLVKKTAKQELIEAIQEKEYHLEKLIVHIDKSGVCSDVYNRVLLEKAIMKKELQNLENDNLCSKLKKLIPRKKTLICDYFKE